MSKFERLDDDETMGNRNVLPLVDFDETVDNCGITDDAHAITRERLTRAVYGEWEPVLLGEVKGFYLDFATSAGFRTVWSHQPLILEYMVNLHERDSRYRAEWSETASILRMSLGDATVVVGVGEGEITRCRYRWQCN